MPRQSNVSFANLTCTFGPDHVLLDYALEIVLPAFFDESMVREHGETKYFFHKVGITDVVVSGISVPQLTVYGEIVKDTMLRRTQVFHKERGLVPDERKMPSAPSAFFALNLNNHKLVYLPETSDAPSINVFGSTLERFLRQKHRDYVRAIHAKLRRAGQPKLLATLFREFPAPEVEVTPMASRATVNEFLDSFDKLTHVEFRILRTNVELSRSETFRSLRRMKDEMEAASGKVVMDNSKGLNKTAAAEEINASAAAGNQKVSLRGTTIEGATLTGSNDNFKLTVQATDIPMERTQRAAHLIQLYFAQVANGSLNPDESEFQTAKIEQLRSALNARREHS